MTVLNPTWIRPGWRFWVLWMLASIAGVFLAILILTPMNWLLFAFENRAIPEWLGISFALIGAVALGGAIGAAPWLVLRRWIARSGWWVLATLLGYGLLLVLPSVFPLRALIPEGELTGPLTGAIMFVVTGAGMGILQWLVLRGHVVRAGLWIAITFAGWVGAYLLTGLFIILGLYIEPMDMLFAFLVPVAVGGVGLVGLLRMNRGGLND